jgi:hypothetical protein
MRMVAAAALIVLVIAGCGPASPGRQPRSESARPSRTFTLRAGERVTYERGEARKGDKIVCIVGGTPIGAHVPAPSTGVAGIGDPAFDSGSAAMINISNESGVVTATCVGG